MKSFSSLSLRLRGVLTTLRPFAGLCKAGQRPCNAIATNARTVGVLLGVATNADVPAIDTAAGDGWLLLAPYGDIDYLHVEADGTSKRFTQVFQRGNADAMVSGFNAVLAKKGARFRGLPIYKGHPDADPQRWPDEARLGGVMALEARDDGLYVRAAWNDQGQQNIAQGYLVYPSPAWTYDHRAAKRTGRIEPDELRSVGLTNSPRIQAVDAWTNSETRHQPADELSDMQLTPEAKKRLIKMLGLSENATDAEVATAINGAPDTTLADLRSTATNAETARTTAENTLTLVRGDLTTRTGERDTAVRERDGFRTTAINALLDGAVNDGRLTAAERTEFGTRFATNFDDAAAALRGKQRALPRQDVTVLRGVDSDLSTPAARSLAWNSIVEEYQDGGKRSLDQAIRAATADPRGKKIREAMDTASKATTAK